MTVTWRKHPFQLLLYVEWVLLGVAILATLTFAIPHRQQHLANHPPLFNLGAVIAIAILGLIGLKLPFGSSVAKLAYILGGFCLSWLAVLLAGRGERVFPALLLVVVIRACLLFPWRGRLSVAVLAYLSFLAVQLMSIMRFNFFGIPLGRPLHRILRRVPPEEAQRVLFGLVFNSSLLFGLVVAFVLLLVSAVLAEQQSREQLTIAHRRLREYAINIENQATLQERNRIAREIHDSVGHYLTAQSIQLENTALFLSKDLDKAQSHLVKARQLGKEALANIRTSVATLRKDPIQARSLAKITEKLTADFKLNTNIAVYSQIDLPTTLPQDITTALYRIVQEALTNITKHSQARNVELRLQKTAQKISLSLKDDGCGFNLTDNTTGFGLQGMQERTAALNGNWKIISKPGEGCHLKVEIPLRHSKST